LGSVLKTSFMHVNMVFDAVLVRVFVFDVVVAHMRVVGDVLSG